MAVGFYYTQSRRHEPIVAAPHPPVDHSLPLGAVVFSFGLYVAWLAELDLVFQLTLAAFAAGAAYFVIRTVRAKCAGRPNVELFVLFPSWVAMTAVLTAVTLAHALNRGKSLGDTAGNVAFALIGGGLLLAVPAAMAGMLLATRAAAGGGTPPGSRARRAVALSCWRTVASLLALPNFFASLAASSYAHRPWASVGSWLALACLAGIAYVVVAQYVLLRPAQTEPAAERDPGYRRPARQDADQQDVSDEERQRLARRELVLGLVALAFAGTVAATHGLMLFG